MCLFPRPNLDTNGIAYKKGVREFDCGACPECLKKRSNIWVLRSVYEAKCHAYNCMITLTYDNFKVANDPSQGELPVDPTIEVSKRHIQLFIKRLRKWYSSITNEKIKYICAAEYGSHTHRAHYHLLLFGVRFSDAHFYKKSKRGHNIYMSKTLTDLWSYGICTIDNMNVQSACARYCTKYCSKMRSPGTFMLFSQSLGLTALRRDFNGLSYWIDGMEYPVPRMVWNDFIMQSYQDVFPWIDYRYWNIPKNPFDEFPLSPSYNVFYRYYQGLKAYHDRRRELFRLVRDSDPLYKRYLSYWQFKGQCFDSVKLPVRTRILQLDDHKYHFYRIRALRAFDTKFDNALAPDSNCGRRSFYSKRGWFLSPNPSFDSSDEDLLLSDYELFKEKFIQSVEKRQSLAVLSCPYTASDTIDLRKSVFNYEKLLTDTYFWYSIYYNDT